MQDSKHRSNLIRLLEDELAEALNDVETGSGQASRLAARWLGYDLADKNVTDGAGDRGIDFWFATDSGFEFFQVKSHNLSEGGRLDLSPFANEGVGDLRRIVEFLRGESPPAETNSRVSELAQDWQMALSKRRLADEPQRIAVTLNLVLFGEGLTAPAKAEFDAFSQSLGGQSINDVPVEFRSRLFPVAELLSARWREDNREWSDKSGHRRETIELCPETNKEGRPQFMARDKSAVFYCRGIDLVTAFDDLGYQIFEPNVRAHIRKSKVNAAIRDSVLHHSSRGQFRFLNNGVTVTCQTFSNPSANRGTFRVSRPGVVNGLQTVVAMHEAFGQLGPDDQKDFENNCYVLVRLLRENAVPDVTKVVLATNTQNPMQPRDLKSNTEEQILYERLFAQQRGWFYGRKQGAWEAFSNDPRRWRTLASYRRSSFQADSGAARGRRRERRVDNEDLAQTWLSFIGLSDEAVHQKRYIFEDDVLYELAFLTRTDVHAAECDFDRHQLLQHARTQSPAPDLMLLSYLAREFAKKMPGPGREVREEAIRRLNLDRTAPPEVTDARLSEDATYLVSLVLSQTSFLFVEFLGYVLFSALGPRVHDAGRALFNTEGLRRVVTTADIDELVAATTHGNLGADDILPVAWSAFAHIVDELIGGAWRQTYLTAKSRTHTNYSKETRSRVIKAFRGLEDFMQRSQLTKAWTAHIPEKAGISDYFRTLLQRSNAA